MQLQPAVEPIAVPACTRAEDAGVLPSASAAQGGHSEEPVVPPSPAARSSPGSGGAPATASSPGQHQAQQAAAQQTPGAGSAGEAAVPGPGHSSELGCDASSSQVISTRTDGTVVSATAMVEELTSSTAAGSCSAAPPPELRAGQDSVNLEADVSPGEVPQSVAPTMAQHEGGPANQRRVLPPAASTNTTSATDAAQPSAQQACVVPVPPAHPAVHETSILGGPEDSLLALLSGLAGPDTSAKPPAHMQSALMAVFSAAGFQHDTLKPVTATASPAGAPVSAAPDRASMSGAEPPALNRHLSAAGADAQPLALDEEPPDQLLQSSHLSDGTVAELQRSTDGGTPTCADEVPAPHQAQAEAAPVASGARHESVSTAHDRSGAAVGRDAARDEAGAGAGAEASAPLPAAVASGTPLIDVAAPEPLSAGSSEQGSMVAGERAVGTRISEEEPRGIAGPVGESQETGDDDMFVATGFQLHPSSNPPTSSPNCSQDATVMIGTATPSPSQQGAPQAMPPQGVATSGKPAPFAAAPPSPEQRSALRAAIHSVQAAAAGTLPGHRTCVAKVIGGAPVEQALQAKQQSAEAGRTQGVPSSVLQERSGVAIPGERSTSTVADVDIDLELRLMRVQAASCLLDGALTFTFLLMRLIHNTCVWYTKFCF